MAYSTGTANDISAMRTALINACTAASWTWDAAEEVLYKSGIYVRIQLQDTAYDYRRMELLGRTALTSGNCLDVVSIGKINNLGLQFPVTYYAFVFTTPVDEVFFVINYKDAQTRDIFQWCAFGKSSQPGLPGGATGNWIAATFGRYYATYQSIDFTVTGLGEGNRITPGFFWGQTVWNPVYSFYRQRINAYVHNNYEEARPWNLEYNNLDNLLSSPAAIESAIRSQPNKFNNETILLPIRAFKMQPDNKVSIVLEVQNARHLRIDYYEPGDIITIDPDSWKVFPYYRKELTARDGGSQIDHSGTFGWAIKYEP